MRQERARAGSARSARHSRVRRVQADCPRSGLTPERTRARAQPPANSNFLLVNYIQPDVEQSSAVKLRLEALWNCGNWGTAISISRRWGLAPGPSAARAGNSPGAGRKTRTPLRPYFARLNSA